MSLDRSKSKLTNDNNIIYLKKYRYRRDNLIYTKYYFDVYKIGIVTRGVINVHVRLGHDNIIIHNNIMVPAKTGNDRFDNRDWVPSFAYIVQYVMLYY